MEVHQQQENVFQPQQFRMRSLVRELRENRLMTQVELAKKAKVAVRTIHSIEKGLECRMFTKRKILLAFGLSLDQMGQVFINCKTRRGSLDS